MFTGMGDASTFVTRCGAVAEVLAANAETAEGDRRVAPASIEAFDAADLRGAIVPASLGGHGLGLADICEGTRTLATGCPASAWTLSFLMLHSWMLGRFRPELRAELFVDGQPPPTAAAPLAPTGSITRAGDGWEVTGRWEWATGVHHAPWVMVHAIEVGPGAPTDTIATRFALLPTEAVAVDDVWHTSGMRATGSDTVVAAAVAVPDHHTIEATALREPGSGAADDPLSPLPMASVLALVASAPAVGAAEAAVDAYRARLAERVLAYSLGDRAADQPLAQARLASVMSDLASTLAGWRAAIDEISAVTLDRPADDGLRVRTRLAAAAAVRSARRIISDVGEGTGAAPYFSSHQHQRLQRDVETLKGHVIFDWDRTTELAGRVALGQPLRPTDMA